MATSYQQLPENSAYPQLAPQQLPPPVAPQHATIQIAEGQPIAMQQPPMMIQQPMQQPQYGYAPNAGVYPVLAVAGVPPGMSGYAAGQMLIQSMPVYVATWVWLLYAFIMLISIAVFVVDFVLVPDLLYFSWIYLLLLLILPIAIWWKQPTRCDVNWHAVTVFTRGTAYALPYDQMVSIEVVRSACCWTGAACTLPRTKFTSFSNSVFFRSATCGQSIGFSPLDLNQFLLALQRTPAGGKIIYV